MIIILLGNNAVGDEITHESFQYIMFNARDLMVWEVVKTCDIHNGLQVAVMCFTLQHVWCLDALLLALSDNC